MVRLEDHGRKDATWSYFIHYSGADNIEKKHNHLRKQAYFILLFPRMKVT